MAALSRPALAAPSRACLIRAPLRQWRRPAPQLSQRCRSPIAHKTPAPAHHAPSVVVSVLYVARRRAAGEICAWRFRAAAALQEGHETAALEISARGSFRRRRRCRPRCQQVHTNRCQRHWSSTNRTGIAVHSPSRYSVLPSYSRSGEQAARARRGLVGFGGQIRGGAQAHMHALPARLSSSGNYGTRRSANSTPIPRVGPCPGAAQRQAARRVCGPYGADRGGGAPRASSTTAGRPCRLAPVRTAQLAEFAQVTKRHGRRVAAAVAHIEIAQTRRQSVHCPARHRR